MMIPAARCGGPDDRDENPSSTTTHEASKGWPKADLEVWLLAGCRSVSTLTNGCSGLHWRALRYPGLVLDSTAIGA